MPRNGSGTMTPDVDFTTEAASPPIEIAKLDTVLEDIADELTNSIAADGQTNPSANLKMNGFKHTNVGAATALTDYGRVSELIDQDHIYYVDSGSANTYVITPSPAIAAYEEGQRFVVRVANANSGASTLNVNGLGAIAVQLADGTAMASGMLAAGGIYEFTYDANTSPDRWVLTSPPSEIPDAMLSANVPLKNGQNIFSGTPQIISGTAPKWVFIDTSGGVNEQRWEIQAADVAGKAFRIFSADDAGVAGNDLMVGTRSGTTWDTFTLAATAIAFTGTVTSSGAVTVSSGGVNVTGDVTTPNTSAAEVGFKGTPLNTQNGDYTLVLTDAGKTIYKASGGAGETITIPANGSVAFPIGTLVDVMNDGGGDLSIAITTDTLVNAAGATGTRTVADQATVRLRKVTATRWRIEGATT